MRCSPAIPPQQIIDQAADRYPDESPATGTARVSGSASSLLRRFLARAGYGLAFPPSAGDIRRRQRVQYSPAVERPQCSHVIHLHIANFLPVPTRPPPSPGSSDTAADAPADRDAASDTRTCFSRFSNRSMVFGEIFFNFSATSSLHFNSAAGP